MLHCSSTLTLTHINHRKEDCAAPVELAFREVPPRTGYL
jgi:hypothetical protein